MLSRRALLAAAFAPPSPKFFFTARGKDGVRGVGSRLGVQRADGSGLQILDFEEQDHIGWLPYCFFRDGRRAILMSLELIPGWRTKSFDEYYPQSKTHLWLYDMETGRREEIATKERLSNFIAPCLLLPGEDRLAVTVNSNGKQRLYIIDLDGRHPKPVSAPDEFVYGVSLSPDGRQFAYHANYRIATINADGSNRQEVNGATGKLMFGTTWSPDGEWILYQICTPKSDPAHDWSDLWIGRPDGSANRTLTTGNAAWFGATYGPRSNPGGGSNMPQWTRHGILFAERSPGAKTPWEFQPQRPDTDHFNRDYKPDTAHGGTRITQLDPKTGEKRALTPFRENQWDFRMAPSANGESVLFCRAATGENPAVWIVDADGANPRFLNRGANNQGADHPRW